jgi:Lon protease-like protein
VASEEIPIFPLSQVVLFPKLRCPLHIFEPRYREMTQAALDGEQRIGMVTVRPEHAADMAGDPPIYAIGCEGRIIDSNQHEDGRIDILLVGTHRFRVLEETPPAGERLYRVAQVEGLSDRVEPGDEAGLASLRDTALAKLGLLLEEASGGQQRFDPSVLDGADDPTAVNALCQILDLHAVEKQSLLEEDRLLERLERLDGLLDFRLAAHGRSAGDPSSTVH